MLFTFIKVPYSIKTFCCIFKWPRLKTGFTVFLFRVENSVEPHQMPVDLDLQCFQK